MKEDISAAGTLQSDYILIMYWISTNKIRNELTGKDEGKRKIKDDFWVPGLATECAMPLREHER